MGLGWMQRLKRNLNSNNEAIQIQNIKLNITENRRKNFRTISKMYFTTTGRSKTCKKIERGSTKITQRTTNLNKTSRPSDTRTKLTIKNGYLEIATEITLDCFVSPAVLTVKKNFCKNCSRL